MVVSVPQIIAAINPDLYLNAGDNPVEREKTIKEFKDKRKKAVDKKGWEKGILEVAKTVKSPQSIRYHLNNGVFNFDMLGGHESYHWINYDSPAETLEPIYFWLMYLIEAFGLQGEKLVDTFSSSVGSGHFAELGQRMSVMQQQGTKLLGDINTVLRSIMNLIYDLKDFKTRLDIYKQLNSESKDTQYAARQNLKQVWLDKVDIQRGQGAIHAMTSGQLGYATLRDAFLAARDESLKDENGKEIDLNERVKRILKPRMLDFKNWLKESEIELTKRYEIEKNYLQSQVNSLKLYSSWARPYLRSAAQLQQRDHEGNTDLVSAFNSILLELSVLGVGGTGAPEAFKPKVGPKHKYHKCILFDFEFRGIPSRLPQQGGYAIGGRVRLRFRGYALSSEELNLLREVMKINELGEAFELIEGATNKSFEKVEEEVKEFLDEKEKEDEEKKKKSLQGDNPFLALIGHYNKKEGKKKDKKGDKKDPLTSENWADEQFRLQAAADAQDTAFGMFDAYKKAHQMPSYT